MGVDLAAVRARVERVGWVQRAQVIRLFPDTVVIAVTERPLMAVWQHAGRTVVVTNNGAIAGQVDPRRFAKLPLIVGDGANDSAGPFIALLQAHPRLWSRVRALVRVDQRRWDLRLADGGVVALPASGEAAAIKRLETLDDIIARPRSGPCPDRPARSGNDCGETAGRNSAGGGEWG